MPRFLPLLMLNTVEEETAKLDIIDQMRAGFNESATSCILLSK